jgi:hypothetical protein
MGHSCPQNRIIHCKRRLVIFPYLSIYRLSTWVTVALRTALYTIKKVSDFPVPSRDVTH